MELDGQQINERKSPDILGVKIWTFFYIFIHSFSFKESKYSQKQSRPSIPLNGWIYQCTCNTCTELGYSNDCVVTFPCRVHTGRDPGHWPDPVHHHLGLYRRPLHTVRGTVLSRLHRRTPAYLYVCRSGECVLMWALAILWYIHWVSVYIYHLKF